MIQWVLIILNQFMAPLFMESGSCYVRVPQRAVVVIVAILVGWLPKAAGRKTFHRVILFILKLSWLGYLGKRCARFGAAARHSNRDTYFDTKKTWYYSSQWTTPHSVLILDIMMGDSNDQDQSDRYDCTSVPFLSSLLTLDESGHPRKTKLSDSLWKSMAPRHGPSLLSRLWKSLQSTAALENSVERGGIII